MEQYKYKDITKRIIGAAMEVHNEIGCGFQEVIYQRSLAIEFYLQNLAYKREFSIPISYKGKEPIGNR